MKTEHQTQLSGWPREQDNNLFAWMCTYTPEELIVAAKLRPFRLYGSANLNKADGYFPINFCPYLKANLSQLLAHEKTFKGVVIVDSCDGARRLYDTIGSYLPHLPRFLLNVPRTVNSDSINFFEYNLNQFKDMLQKLTGSTISSQELILAIDQVNKKKNYLKGLKQAYTDNRISLIDYYRLVRISATSSRSCLTVKLISC
ncbi:MAG: 2-hydroxyacyl-CoA dehydratase family protein [Actinomycetota bacterium]|nr:2-hydroxyacyl-CoA dehydratase family protein [Actinomycetota bacterium]